VKLLESTLDATAIPRPEPAKGKQHLCADAAYVGAPSDQAMRQRGLIPHVRSRGEEKKRKRRGSRPRRWVVERTHSWFNRFRKLLVRFEKTAISFIGLLELAASLICWRRTVSIYG
jgi:transposase